MKYLRSRTVWTLIFMFVFNGFAALNGQVPQNVFMAGNAVLTALGIIFRVNPKQDFNA